MLNNWINTNISFYYFTGFIPIIFLITYSYINKTNIKLASIVSFLIAILFFISFYKYHIVISAFFITLSLYSVFNRHKNSSLKLLAFAFFSIMLAIVPSSYQAYLILNIFLMCILIYDKTEASNFIIFYPVSIILYLLIWLKLLVFNIDTMNYLTLSMILLIQIKYILVQKNFNTYLVLPLIVFSYSINYVFSFSLFILYSLILLLRVLKLPYNFILLFILNSNNIISYSIFSFYKKNLHLNNYFLVIIFVAFIISLFIYFEKNQKFVFNYKSILIYFFSIIFLFLPVFLLDKFVIDKLNYYLLGLLILIILNARFLKIFEKLNIAYLNKNLSNIFLSSITKTLLIFNRLYSLNFKLKILILNLIKTLFFNFINYKKLLLKKLYFFLIFFKNKLLRFFILKITLLDNLYLKQKFEIVFFIFSLIIIIIITFSEVL